MPNLRPVPAALQAVGRGECRVRVLRPLPHQVRREVLEASEWPCGRLGVNSPQKSIDFVLGQFVSSLPLAFVTVVGLNRRHSPIAMDGVLIAGFDAQ